MDPTVIIAGASLMTNLMFRLQGIKSKKTKMLFSFHKTYFNHTFGVAMKVSISNVGNKPFSILDIYLSQTAADKEQRYSACRVIDVKALKSRDQCDGVDFISDMLTVRTTPKTSEDYVSLSPFDFKAFLQPNQAETGWIVFPIKPENLIFSNIVVLVSGEEELFTKVN